MENPVILLYWIGTLTLLLAFAGMIFIAMLYQNKMRRIRQEEAELMVSNAIATEKKERKRIATDLHDSIGGDLLAVNNFLALLGHYIQDPEGKAFANEVSEIVRKTLSQIQAICYGLMPPDMDDTALVPALEEYFNRLRKAATVNITAVFSGSPTDLSPEHRYELFRVVQEIIGNMLKHGRVSEIKFWLEQDVHGFQMEIRDNGQRFDFYATLAESRGLGLHNIVSRCRHIGAHLEQKPAEQDNRMVISYRKKKKTNKC